ncbi:hypothetical protein Leryth_018949 [Lithospermum erythrorhizon]|nr:hypothetical protein Leryth_018949 [Lithospermum erythrorhizon]
MVKKKVFNFHFAYRQRIVPDEYHLRTFCLYETNASSVYGLAAFGLLLVSQTIINGVTKCFCCGKRIMEGRSTTCAMFFFVFSWVTFLGAEACLLAGSARNAYHTKDRGIFGGIELACATLHEGVFAAGAALSLLTMIGSILYYWFYSKADTQGWEKQQSRGLGMAPSHFEEPAAGTKG